MIAGFKSAILFENQGICSTEPRGNAGIYTQYRDHRSVPGDCSGSSPCRERQAVMTGSAGPVCRFSCMEGIHPGGGNISIYFIISVRECKNQHHLKGTGIAADAKKIPQIPSESDRCPHNTLSSYL